MRLLLRAAAVSSFLAAVAVAGLSACPTLADEVEALTLVMDDQARLAAAEESIARIDQESELVQRRAAIKQEVVRDLLEGRLTFDDAVRMFADSNRMQESATTYLRRRYPGRTDDERAAWQLIGYLRLTHNPRARMLADQGECELSLRS
jgi:hypothetical protein